MNLHLVAAITVLPAQLYKGQCMSIYELGITQIADLWLIK